MAKMTVVMNGDEAEFNITAKLARAIAQVVAGGLSAKQLPPMPPNLLPLANGVLDLDTMEMREHNPENLNRWLLPHTYDPVATCPSWEKFLTEAVPEEAEWLQQWTGYCLGDGNPFERMAWLYGPPGTGKSTFIKALTKLFAESAVAITAERVGEYTVASLAGKRLAVCTEISSAMLKTVVLKQLISGDPTDARHPYGRPFSVAFSGKFMFASNVLPPVDQGEGLWRRLAIIAFDNKPRVSDPLLQHKLESEMSGILNWAIKGRQQLTEIGGTWDLPRRILSLVGEYQESSDLFSQFVSEELELDSDSEISGKELYARYSYWMREHGQTAEPFGTLFWHNLKLAGLTTLAPRRIGGRIIRMWRGARLVADTFLSK
jgi:putative DNA primase/helicase